MVDVLLRSSDRVHDLYGVFFAHVIEVVGTNEQTSWAIAIDALDRAVVGILDECLRGGTAEDSGAMENMLLVALESLFSDTNHRPIRLGVLRISLHVLQLRGESLTRGWDPMVLLLKSVPEILDAEIVSTAFDSVELLVNVCLDQLPYESKPKGLRVVSAFAKQATAMHVSLSSINLLWSAVDMFGKGRSLHSQIQSQNSFPGVQFVQAPVFLFF